MGKRKRPQILLKFFSILRRWRKNEKLPAVIMLSLLFIAAIGLEVYSKVQYQRTGNALKSIIPHDIILFRIHAKGVATEFRNSDAIVDDFFKCLRDFYLYLPSHDTVASQEHGWWVEIGTKKTNIKIRCYIPSGKNNIVVGELGKVNNKGGFIYGYFQSHQLFQWYQTYKDRWLTPSVPPPGATAAPTPP